MKRIEKHTHITGGGKGIIYVDGKYYLLSDSPAKVCVSEDLENWTEYQLKSNYYNLNYHLDLYNIYFLIYLYYSTLFYFY